MPNQILSLIPKGASLAKFVPPGLPRILSRPRLLNQLSKNRRKKAFLISAQAGQGKTTLIMDYLKKSPQKAAWYCLGPEDRDPLTFFKSLLIALFVTGPKLEFRPDILPDPRELLPSELKRYAVLLSNYFHLTLDDDLYLVLDNYRFVRGENQVNSLVIDLIKLTPQGFHIIILSREEIELDLPRLAAQREILRLDNEALRFTSSEIKDFFLHLYDEEMSSEDVRYLEKLSQGWITALILVYQALRGAPVKALREQIQRICSFKKKGDLFSYLGKEIFGRTPPDLQRFLINLAPLKEIPLALASKLAPDGKAERWLWYLVNNNLLVNEVPKKNGLFRFHPLFRAFLQREQGVCLKVSEIRSLLLTFGDYFLGQGEDRLAVKYYLESKNYGQALQIIRRRGIEWIESFELDFLATCISRFPKAWREREPWLLLIQGSLLVFENHTAAYALVKRARFSFRRKGERFGCLAALSWLIRYHYTVDGWMGRIGALVREAERIFEEMEDTISDYSRAGLLADLGAGSLFGTCEISRGLSYARKAIELSDALDLRNLGTLATAILGFNYMTKGEMSKAKLAASKALKALEEDEPRTNDFTRVHVHILRANILLFNGEFSLIGPIIRLTMPIARSAGMVNGILWLLYAKGQASRRWSLKAAMSCFDQGEELATNTGNLHMVSMFKAFKAQIYTHLGDQDDAIRLANESKELREQIGGQVFVIYNRLDIAAVNLALARYDEALPMLQSALKDSKRLRLPQIVASAHIELYWLYKKKGRPRLGRRHLENFFRVMSAGQYKNCYYWNDEMVLDACLDAVRAGIHDEYARFLARETLGLHIDPDGNAIPILEINALGPLMLRLGEVELSAQTFTPLSRKLLGILLRFPGRNANIDEIMVLLWPDADADRARASLDSALRRLRKSLAPLVEEKSTGVYLHLSRGILSLKHVKVDIDVFLQGLDRGAKALENGDLLGALNGYELALGLYRGPYMQQGPFVDSIIERQRELKEQYLAGLYNLAYIYFRLGMPDESIRELEKILTLDPIRHEAYELLQGIYKRYFPEKLAKLPFRYARALNDAGFDSHEVSSTIKNLMGDPLAPDQKGQENMKGVGIPHP